MLKGTLLGMVSAVGYSAANIALRDLSNTAGLDWAFFVSAAKAIPCCLAAWVFVLYRRSRGLESLPPRGRRLPLLVAAIMMQIGGNVMFLWSLSYVGLVLTVPMAFATLICGSAVLGRIFLGEPIDSRTLVSILTLISSILCLSLAAQDSLPNHEVPAILLGLGLAAVSGLSYGANSIVIRRFVGDQSVSSVIVVMSTTGVILLGGIGVTMLGAEKIATITAGQWQMMVWAGIANAIAFFAVCTAMRFIPAVRANLLNASQTAMCAVAGVLLFEEKLTGLLGLGIALTIAGLFVLGVRRARWKKRPVREPA